MLVYGVCRIMQKKINIVIAVLTITSLLVIGYVYYQSKQEKITPLSDVEWQSQKADLDKISEENKKYCEQLNGAPVQDVEAAKDCKYSK